MSGTIGIFSSDLARYSDFTDSLVRLQKPQGTMLAWARGAHLSGACNKIVEAMEGDWLWFIGDDHVFPPDTLTRLIAHDVDIVVPLCLTRVPPYDPVVFSGVAYEENDITYYTVAELEPEGLQEIHVAGTAGMLIRRHVFEGMESPWFRTRGAQNEDLEFCAQAQEAGFRIWCDPTIYMGHIAPHTVWPRWTEEGLGAAVVLDQDTIVPIRRVAQPA